MDAFFIYYHNRYLLRFLLVDELPLEDDLPEDDFPLELPLEVEVLLLVGGLDTVLRVVDLVVAGLEALLLPVLLRVGVV